MTDTIESLTAIYTEWLIAEGLPFISAEELATEDIRADQVDWLYRFIDRWNVVEEWNDKLLRREESRDRCMQHRYDGRGFCIDCGEAMDSPFDD